MRFKNTNKIPHPLPIVIRTSKGEGSVGKLNLFKTTLQFPFIFLIRVYKYLLSPLLPNACRYTPTCSQYAEEAIKKYGVFKGIYVGAKRIARCHPWGGHGYDPLP